MHKAGLLRTSLPPGYPDVAQRAAVLVAVVLGCQTDSRWAGFVTQESAWHSVPSRGYGPETCRRGAPSQAGAAVRLRTAFRPPALAGPRSLVRVAMCRAMYSASRPTPPTSDDASELRKNKPMKYIPGSAATPRWWIGRLPHRRHPGGPSRTPGGSRCTTRRWRHPQPVRPP